MGHVRAHIWAFICIHYIRDITRWGTSVRAHIWAFICIHYIRDITLNGVTDKGSSSIYRTMDDGARPSVLIYGHSFA